jgi:hypothetical protein
MTHFKDIRITKIVYLSETLFSKLKNKNKNKTQLQFFFLRHSKGEHDMHI